MTIADAVAGVEARLITAGVDTPKLDAQILVAHSLGVDRSYVLAHASDIFDGKGLELISARREAREPLAYILGWREFFGRRFIVTPDVLIPRQETETLVEQALAEKHVKDALDIGTGSGCIALTLALERPDWNVTAVDLSEAALAIARQNVARLVGPILPNLQSSELPNQPELTRTPELLLSDLFSALGGRTYDLIVSNPPYVADTDHLPPEVHAYEPHTALYAGSEGLEVYERLARDSHHFLRPTGALMVELGDGQSLAVQAIFEENGWYVEKTANDLGGTPRAAVLKPLVSNRDRIS